MDVALPEQRHQRVGAEAAIGQHQIPGLERFEQALEQAQFVLVFVAFGVIEQRAGGQAEDADQLQEGKTATRLLSSGLGISALILLGIGQADAGAINDFDAKPLPELARAARRVRPRRSASAAGYPKADAGAPGSKRWCRDGKCRGSAGRIAPGFG